MHRSSLFPCPVLPVPMKSTEVVGKGWSQRGRLDGWFCVAEWILGKQNPVGGSSGGQVCRQFLHFLTGWWREFQGREFHHFGSELSCLARVDIGGGEAWDMPKGLESESWGSTPGRPVTHLFFKLVWAAPVPMESAGVAEKG